MHAHMKLCMLLKGRWQAPFPLLLSYHGLKHLCLNSVTSRKTSVSTGQNQLLFLLLFETAKQNSVYFNS